jgi:hypothetical protein
MSSTYSLRSGAQGCQHFLAILPQYILYVQVPKAASTSWLFAYLQMAGVPEQEIPDVR